MENNINDQVWARLNKQHDMIMDLTASLQQLLHDLHDDSDSTSASREKAQYSGNS